MLFADLLSLYLVTFLMFFYSCCNVGHANSHLELSDSTTIAITMIGHDSDSITVTLWFLAS